MNNKADIYAFTWNLKWKQDALQLGLSYLNQQAEKRSVIGCFQETPTSELLTTLRRNGGVHPDYPNLLIVGAGPANDLVRGITTVHSKDFNVQNVHNDEDGEFQLANLQRRNLPYTYSIINLHGSSRSGRDALEVSGCLALLRQEISILMHKGFCNPERFLLIGDFNADWKSSAVTSWDTFFAPRSVKPELLMKSRKMRRGVPHHPFQPVPISFRDGALEGTYVLVGTSVNTPHLLDFAVTHPNVAIESTASILGELRGHEQLRNPDDPDRISEKYGDHFPVEALIRFHGLQNSPEISP